MNILQFGSKILNVAATTLEVVEGTANTLKEGTELTENWARLSKEYQLQKIEKVNSGKIEGLDDEISLIKMEREFTHKSRELEIKKDLKKLEKKLKKMEQ